MSGTREILKALNAVQIDPRDDLPPSYNVAPSHDVRVVLQGPSRVLAHARWGLAASWKGSGGLVINARVESVFEKQTFRALTAQHRCVIPMTGYFEWLTNASTSSQMLLGRKTPFFISADPGSSLLHGELLVAAGLVRNGEHGLQCVMLTRSANTSVRYVHDRMPLLLDQAGMDQWLSAISVPNMDVVSEGSLVELSSRRVSMSVNSVRNNGPQLLEDGGSDTLF